MQQIYRFQPVYQERVWGGRALQDRLGRTLPTDAPVGESWEIVDRPEAQSIVRGGALNGLPLRAVLERHGENIMGPQWPRERPFPILVKWLDCRERLSLQVHPPADIAPSLGGEPKTENWYIAEATKDATLYVGLKRGITREKFEQALRAGVLETCVHQFPVATGDSILVRSGRVHAIGGGNLILEIQQNSDTTYRVYDWGRVGLDGKPRALHVAESLKSIRWDDQEPQPVRPGRTAAVIADAPEFRIQHVPLAAGESMRLAAGEQPRILSVVDGAVDVHADGGVERLVRGDNVLLAFAGAFRIEASAPAGLLITENFARSLL